MENWNRNEWQGKRKDQVDYSYKAVLFVLILGIIGAIVYNVYFLVQ